jgi:hypothetical protein
MFLSCSEEARGIRGCSAPEMAQIEIHSKRHGKEEMQPLAGVGCSNHKAGVETKDLEKKS